jgi:hypothetical protein
MGTRLWKGFFILEIIHLPPAHGARSQEGSLGYAALESARFVPAASSAA